MGLRPFMRARLLRFLAGDAIAGDEARRNAEKARAGDEDMGEIARPSARQRERLDGGAAASSRQAKGDGLVEGRSSADASNRADRRRLRRFGGEVAQRPIDVSERALAQIHLRRQPLDGAPDHARRVAGLDFACR